jgi:ketosteroid isomerase-like protein
MMEGLMTDRQTIENALNGLVDAFNAHDLDRIMTFFTDDCVLQMPRGPNPFGQRAEGAVAVKATLATRFEGIPDVHYGEDSHYIDGNVGVSKWLLTGTTAAEQKIAVRGCDFYEFRDGKATMKDSYWKIVE